ncbi:CCA tRNA nucleotidyltransferase [Cohnella silvisoli]|uniref:CCA tRNA nucleotidyltransferase n=1 Tax=Cohnella silvisoli TaxID=2873699 RepID=A0ABV1KNX5_9BACL|nr:CCA tRNA nucleotidyltransferase [Cohnella silvisoli]MCD9021163.1 CCA tRNA nucleotidyltransferase [Cohnella silvisoli]
MDEQDEILWAEGLEVIRKLVLSGHQAYLVGGCVRDKFMGRRLNDIDIATSAKPDEVVDLFARTVPTGVKHGTVTVLENGRSFEVTTFRQEFGYSDSRRPDEVAFVLDVREDLARRDFTMNAMAVGLDGEVVDPFGGREDMQAGVVRCVGEAFERFSEDALRMLRAIRFAAEFDFTLLPEVKQAIIKHRSKLRQVAIERVSVEWDKMMAGSGPEQACHYLLKSGLLTNLKEPLPAGFQTVAEQYRFNELPWEWDITFSGIGSLENDLLYLPLIADPDLRWAALFAGMGLSEKDSMEICGIFRISGRRTTRIAGVVGMSEQLTAFEEHSLEYKEQWIRLVLAYGRTIAEDWLELNESCKATRLEESSWLEEMPAASISELDVRGDELSRLLDKSPGPWIAELLERLLEEVALGCLPNDKGSLLATAKSTIGNRES